MDSKPSSVKTRSYASMSTTRSHGSATSTAAAKARAKAEAAKARLAFAEQEMKLKMEKARLEASIEMLTTEKETAAAVAKAEALEAAVGVSEGKHSCKLPLIATSVDSAERTKEYVEKQAEVSRDIQMASQEDLPLQDETQQPLPEEPLHNTVCMPRLNSLSDGPPDAAITVFDTPLHPPRSLNPFVTSDVNRNSAQQTEHHYYGVLKENDYEDFLRPSCSVTAQQPPWKTNSAMEALPHHPYGNSQRPSYSTEPHVTDFVRFLARRELVTSGLLQFNDRPENYRAWRRSFQNAVRDLNLTSDEEMDLLVKWLGSESAEHAKRIRSIHINQPAKGLSMIWNRLDASYGSSEAIEKA